MKDVYKELRQAYFTALNGNIAITDASSNSINVSIYDNIPNNATYPYVYFEAFDLSENSAKDTYMTIATMVLTVYTRYESAFGGSLDSDNISNQIISLIKASSLTMTNFNSITTRVTSRVNDKAISGNYKFIMAQIRIEHNIEQK